MSDGFSLVTLPTDIYDEILKFLDDESLFVFLTLSKKISVSKYLLQHRKWLKYPIEKWTGMGDIKAVKFLLSRGVKCTKEAAYRAIHKGELDMFNFLRINGAPWDAHAMLIACTSGRLEIFKQLHMDGVSYHMDGMLQIASRGGYLELVKFLINNGAPKNIEGPFLTSPFLEAVQSSHLDVVEYLYSVGVTVNGQEAMFRACYLGYLPIIKFLHSIGCRSPRAINGVSYSGNVEALKYLDRNGYTCHEDTDSMDVASFYGHLEVVKYLHSIGAKFTRKALIYARVNGYLNIVNFLNTINTESSLDIQF